MHHPPAPQPRHLLPPLLACLPTTFLSPTPPPALLPLLAPVLRQRCAFLRPSAPSSSDGWVKLLSWHAERAAKLPSIVEHLDLEPHPVAGEVEVDDVRAIKYRRVDDETLHARIEAAQFDLLPTYLWCDTDEHAGTGPGWKLAELRSLEDIEDGSEWYDSISEAESAASTHTVPTAPTNGNTTAHPTPHSDPSRDPAGEEDDADYWASYDRTPGRTPAHARSPIPPTSSTQQPTNTSARERSRSELEYYARYGSEVQPALDSHNPDEEHAEIGSSTLTGESLTQLRAEDSLARPQTSLLQPHEDSLARPQTAESTPHPPAPRPSSRESWQKALYPHAGHDSAIASTLDTTTATSSADEVISMPRPVSPTSSHSSVEKLEERATAMSSSPGAEECAARAERGIKQHISTDIKSLFRLARSVGLERREFDRIVRRELEVLGLLEEDD